MKIKFSLFFCIFSFFPPLPSKAIVIPSDCVLSKKEESEILMTVDEKENGDLDKLAQRFHNFSFFLKYIFQYKKSLLKEERYTYFLRLLEKMIQDGADIHEGYEQGNTKIYPLAVATEYGYKEVVEILLKNGADIHNGLKRDVYIDFYSDKVGSFVSETSPLEIACRNSHADICYLLCLHGSFVIFTKNKECQKAMKKGFEEYLKKNF